MALVWKKPRGKKYMYKDLASNTKCHLQQVLYTHLFTFHYTLCCLWDMYIINKNGAFFWFSSNPPQNSGKRDKREHYLKVFFSIYTSYVTVSKYVRVGVATFYRRKES